MSCLPEMKGFDLPKNGLKDYTYYIVDVAWYPTNPIHRSILYTGFLISGLPGGYSGIFNPSYEGKFKQRKQPYYMKVIREIAGPCDMMPDWEVEARKRNEMEAARELVSSGELSELGDGGYNNGE